MTKPPEKPTILDKMDYYGRFVNNETTQGFHYTKNRQDFLEKYNGTIIS